MLEMEQGSLPGLFIMDALPWGSTFAPPTEHQYARLHLHECLSATSALVDLGWHCVQVRERRWGTKFRGHNLNSMTITTIIIMKPSGNSHQHYSL